MRAPLRRGETMIRFCVSGEARAPERVECDGEGYDASGRPVMLNTHFPTEAEAWAWLLADSQIAIKWAEQDLAHARESVRAASVRRKSILARKRRAAR
jgi:hypothetical protein